VQKDAPGRNAKITFVVLHNPEEDPTSAVAQIF
jgi:hypothetical protein